MSFLAKACNRSVGGKTFPQLHHSSSSVALSGGGLNSRPGEIAAHNGVLFWMNFRISASCLAPYEPMETGDTLLALSRLIQRVSN
ncbi:MAG: ATP-binding protein [Candidatus Eutrophobiaceae bacterium]